MRRFYKAEIDYSKSHDKRMVMTNYLRTGPFRQISGRVLHGRKIHRRRVFLVVLALAFLAVGLYGILQ